MSRALYIGGCFNGERIAKSVKKSLEDYYDEVEAFTFSKAMREPHAVKDAAQEADATTHSAGMTALVAAFARPKHLDAFNAPIPTANGRVVRGVYELISATSEKTADMFMINDEYDGTGVDPLVFVGSSLAEGMRHPVSNARPLGRIIRFDAFKEAEVLEASGVDVNLFYTDLDVFFRVNENRPGQTMLEGVHDQLPLSPSTTLASAYAKTGR